MKAVPSARCSLILLSCLLVSACVSVEVRPELEERPTRDPATWHWSVPDPKPHVTHGVVHSNVMDRDVGYNIYLPPSYSKQRAMRFPVVYFLHGAGGSEYSDTSIVDLVIPQIRDGTIGEVIYVFVNGGHYSRYRDNPTTNVMAETYIVRELIPAIDSRYRTIADREGRALFGFSMGGGGATRLALKYPSMFCAVGSISGSLDPTPDRGESSLEASAPRPDNIYDWATRNREQVRNRIGFYFTVGGEETLYERHPPFMAHLKSLDIAFNYRVEAGLGHNLGRSSVLFGRDIVAFLDSQYRNAYVPEIP